MNKSAYRIVFIAALVVLGLAIISLGAIGVSYWTARSTYDDIASEAFGGAEIEDVSADSSVLDRTLSTMVVDWEALKARNPDTVAWLRMPSTRIDYPVVWCGDNETYLTRDFDGKEGVIVTAGTVFLEAKNSPTFADDACFLYGHNLNDGSMFATIAGLEDPSAFRAHRTLYLATPGGNVKLRSFAICHYSAQDAVIKTFFSNDQAMSAYVQDKMDRSIVAADDLPKASSITRVFALSTCDNRDDNGRWILFCYVEESANPAIPAVQHSGVFDVKDKPAF